MDTMQFKIQRQFPFNLAITRRMAKLMYIFGLTMFRLDKMSSHHVLDVTLRPGDICYITGASGSGKSILLREMEKIAPRRRPHQHR